MTDAGPLALMTNLHRLHIWLGANSELPCSNKPLRGLLAAAGKLARLTELQLLKGLFLSWELRKIVQLDNLTDLQVRIRPTITATDSKKGAVDCCAACRMPTDT